MPRKRKRTGHGHGVEGDQKREKAFKDDVVKQALLAQYYTEVVSLRQYLLSKLPTASKIRRKKIQNLGCGPDLEDGKHGDQLGLFMDQTLIGVLQYNDVSPEERLQQWTSFSQRVDASDSAFANLSGVGTYSQSEIVDFAIWLLFSKAHNPSRRVQHLLCQGFQRDVSSRSVHRDANITSAIAGVISTYPNSHVTCMKASPWPQILSLLGKEGERVMIDLILDCGVFLPVETGWSSYHQLSGQPLGDLPVISDNDRNDVSLSSRPKTKSSQTLINRSNPTHSPASIIFVRNRMLYARAALNARGRVRFGLRHIHVLNRYPYILQHASLADNGPQQSTIHVMMYVFPRQFGLHNVFTSEVDPQETVQPFKDYALREDEIHGRFSFTETMKVPRRLRGRACELVQKLQIHHSRCPYKILLEHYCPAFHNNSSKYIPSQQLQQANDSDLTTFKTQKSVSTDPGTSVKLSNVPKILPRKPSLMDHAIPTAMVSAFCRAVLSKLIPHEFWGAGDVQAHNERVFYRNVDRFIALRRFESLSLHEVSQGIKITNIEWLGPPQSAFQKISQSDLRKRLEIFNEFLYYLFDSILIPLVRANFHVTESNIHRYRIFFFRHDVWRSLAEPAMALLKLTMFEEIKTDHAQKILNSRVLGFSQVRLLPKETGVRPIMNLRRRSLKKGYNVLGSSINSVLAPVYNVLTFEKELNPDRLGSTLFSVGDLYKKLKSFKLSIQDPSKPLYFAKVDVQSAFDTIPQSAVIQLMSSLSSESEYRISRHVELKPGDGFREGNNNTKPIRKWVALAKAPNDFQTFEEHLESDLAVGRKNTIFVENVVNQLRDKDELLNLLTEHVQRNMVKIGKKFYRQKEGIPQGSVLSSLLCNYFYADLEVHHLEFLQSGNSLLLRLIDDFLLITSDLTHAKKFLQTMHDGLPSYGVRVNPGKTLVNFEATINGKKVERLVGSRSFPYCGSFIDTKTLNITKDRERRKDMAIEDSLTVEFSRVPGKTSHRKALNTFKIQAHAMFLDTSHNSLNTVLSNIHSAFIETATKMYTYNRCLPVGKQPGMKLVIKTISDLIELAFLLIKGKGKSKRNEGYACVVKKVQVEWLAINAFRYVLRKRQSRYTGVLEWLTAKIVVLMTKEPTTCDRMKGIVMNAVD